MRRPQSILLRRVQQCRRRVPLPERRRLPVRHPQPGLRPLLARPQKPMLPQFVPLPNLNPKASLKKISTRFNHSIGGADNLLRVADVF